MSMTFFQNYLENISKSPSENYKDLQQAFVDTQWYDSTLEQTIYEETFHGSFKFKPVDAWKNSIGEFTVQISKNEKDYRRLLFRDQRHKVERGRLYDFDDNYWITYDPTSDIEPYAEVYVRRCNNWLKWIDRENGQINCVPCVLDYEVGSPSPQKSKTTVLPNGHVVLWVQGNELTRKIRKNDRFIFNGDPYKFTSYNAYLQQDYVDELVPMLYMDLYLDEIQPSDDLENNIANRGEIDYSITITQGDFAQSTGGVGKLNATVVFNGDTVEREIDWISMNDNINIDSDGNYVIVGENGTQGIIRAYIMGNNETYDEITINIDEGSSQKKLVFEPYFEEISQNETIRFNVNVYIDGTKQADAVQANVNNLDGTYYSLVTNNNVFEITAKKISTTPLSITFSDGDINETIELRLKSLF